MTPKKTSPGFSLLIIILIIVILLGLGVGGYFAYTNYFAPKLNPTAQLIPDSLKEYAKGKDADGFIIYKKDQDIDDEIIKLPSMLSKMSYVKDALVLIKGSSTGFAAVEFNSVDQAQEAKAALGTFGQSASSIAYTVELKDKFLLFTLGEGLNSFNGSLLDNPNLAKIDKDMQDSQFIAYFDNAKLPESGQFILGPFQALPDNIFEPTTQAFINAIPATAHAQGFLSATDSPARIDGATGGQESNKNKAYQAAQILSAFFKDTFVSLSVKKGVFSTKIIVNLLQKNELSTSILSKTSIPAADLEKSYTSSLDQLNSATPAITKALASLKTFLPTLVTNYTFENTTIKLDINIPSTDLNNSINYLLLPVSLGAPQKARNAARKADLNSIMTAIEAYNSDKNEYPQKSNCLENLSELDQYLAKNKAPVDFSGPQSLGSYNCTSGYFYQNIPNRGYILWSKLEGAQGNTNEIPETITPKINDQAFIDSLQTTKDGQYFIVLQISPTKTSDSAPDSQSSTTKVSTQTSPPSTTTNSTTAASDPSSQHRDDIRKTDLANISTALEMLNTAKNYYPKNSGCLEDVQELLPYFPAGKLPTDPNGAQNFDKTPCTSGYYYGAPISGGVYRLVAKMELSKNGNGGFTSIGATGHMISYGSMGGQYYVLSNNKPAITTPLAPPIPPSSPQKVRRQPSAPKAPLIQ